MTKNSIVPNIFFYLDLKFLQCFNSNRKTYKAEYFRPKSCLKIEEISISYFCKLMLPLPWIVDEWYLIFCQADKIYDKQEVVGENIFSCAVSNRRVW